MAGAFRRYDDMRLIGNCCILGPVSDQLVRTAYVAGYDRRLRHPAWVRHIAPLSAPCHSCLFIDGGTSHTSLPREVAARARVG